MSRKPWPIIILSAFFFLVPIFNLFFTYYFIREQTSLGNYFYSLFYLKSNYPELFNMVAPGFISGIAIYSVKKWSYPVIVCCILWLGVNSYFNVAATDDIFLMVFATIIPMIFNIAIVSYFLIPSVKTTYYDPRVRWWEAKPRYIIDSIVSITAGEREATGTVTNFSEGGIFLKTTELFETDTVVKVEFELNEIKLNLAAKVIFKTPSAFAYGLQFEQTPPQVIKQIKDLIKHLDTSGTEVARPIPLWDEDLKKWFFNLLKTGKGFTPELPGNAPPKK